MDRPELPMTAANAQEVYEWMFAPWVRAQGHEILEVSAGRVVTRLPTDPSQAHFGGVTCGQALMSAVDTAMALAICTLDQPRSGTAAQNTRFVRPAQGEPLRLEARVLHSGRRAAYGEVHVRGEVTETLVAHATCEFL